MIEINLVQNHEILDSYQGFSFDRFDLEFHRVSTTEISEEERAIEERDTRLGLIALCSTLFDENIDGSSEYYNFIKQVLAGSITDPHITRIMPYLRDDSNCQDLFDARMRILSEKHRTGDLTTDTLIREKTILERATEAGINYIDSDGRLCDWEDAKGSLRPTLFVCDTLGADGVEDEELEEIVVPFADMRYHYQYPLRRNVIRFPKRFDVDWDDQHETVGFIASDGEFEPIVTFLSADHYERVSSSSRYFVQRLVEQMTEDGEI